MRECVPGLSLEMTAMEVDFDPKLVSSLAIPPRPDIVVVLGEEMRREDPDLGRIARQIAADVGLSSGMLKVVNSAAFGRGARARSVAHAVDLLGLRNVAGIATGLALRHALEGGGMALGRFWDTAEKTALICASLARSLRGIPVDEAYTLGLFHDCGIPVLMQHFPAYRDTLARANHTGDRSFTAVEEADVGTHHCAVGYFLARSWRLPDAMCRAILWHHDPAAFAHAETPDAVRNYVGIVHIAEQVQHHLMRSAVNVEWPKFEALVMDHFGLTGEDFINLVDAAQDAVAVET